jgi:hypothetical protein
VQYIRTLSVIAIVTACSFAIYCGWEIARFGVIEAGLDQYDNRKEVLRSYFAVLGLTSTARQAALPQEIDPVDKKNALERGRALTELLSVRPLSATHWLSLSKIRLIAGEAADNVTAALTLSDITGGYEEDVLLERGIFCMSLWERLPAELQRRTVGELAAALLLLGRGDRGRLRAALVAKTEKTRQEIRTAFLQTGSLSTENLAEIGL